MSVCLSVCVSAPFSVCNHLIKLCSVCPSVFMSVRPYVRTSLCPYVLMSVRPCVPCPLVHPSTSGLERIVKIRDIRKKTRKSRKWEESVGKNYIKILAHFYIHSKGLFLNISLSVDIGQNDEDIDTRCTNTTCSCHLSFAIYKLIRYLWSFCTILQDTIF